MSYLELNTVCSECGQSLLSWFCQKEHECVIKVRVQPCPHCMEEKEDGKVKA